MLGACVCVCVCVRVCVCVFVFTRTLLLAAQFLQEELPVRLARRARELRKLPFGLGDTTSIKVYVSQVRAGSQGSGFEG
jgi:hypothetical protein